jgi:Zn-dependent protease with chaperone function
MALMLRMMTAMVSLYVLFIVGLFMIGLILGAPFILVVVLAFLFVFLEWWIGPWIIRHVYKIDWVALEFFDPEIQDYVSRVVREHNIRMPRLGIVRDGNPNAFCFGRTRNDAYLVVTQGILDYCDTAETKAVIGHELGHIVHNDFIVMTMISAVPIVFYILYRSCLDAARRPHYGNSKNDPRAYIFTVAIIAFVIYFISNLIVLLISRYREYWADRFSAETTKDTAPLINALVTIAYGLAMESKKSKENKVKDKIYENSLMIFDSKVARNLAFSASSVRDSSSEVSIQDMKEAMAWDLWNPWGAYFEIFMSHPLPAKRLIHLDSVGKEMGIEPYLDFDLRKPPLLRLRHGPHPVPVLLSLSDAVQGHLQRGPHRRSQGEPCPGIPCQSQRQDHRAGQPWPHLQRGPEAG